MTLEIAELKTEKLCQDPPSKTKKVAASQKKFIAHAKKKKKKKDAADDKTKKHHKHHKRHHHNDKHHAAQDVVRGDCAEKTMEYRLRRENEESMIKAYRHCTPLPGPWLREHELLRQYELLEMQLLIDNFKHIEVGGIPEAVAAEAVVALAMVVSWL